MKIFVSLLLNAALLALVLPWLWRQWRWAASGPWRTVLGLGLGLRVAAGVARSVPPKLDAAYMSSLAQVVTAQLWAAPGTAWQLLTRAVTVFPESSGGMVYQNSSNTWILIKLLAILNLASLGTAWLNALYLSVFAFVGCWRLVRTLASTFPATPAAAGVVAFLFWPSVWFWATGISKEAVLLSSGAWLTANVLDCLYRADGRQSAGQWVGWGIGTLALAGLHIGLRYFFAVPLLGVLGGVALGQLLARVGLVRHRWAQALVFATFLLGGAWLTTQVSKAFSVNKFTNQVVNIYAFDVAHSVGRPHFEYPDLRPTISNFAAHAPQAIANALTRPWLSESWQPVYVAASLENGALLVLMALAAWAVARGRPGRLPFVLTLGLLVFCLTLAFLVGLTTPNLGALNRYRCALLPYLLLLLLQNDYATAALRRLRLPNIPTTA